MQDAFQALMDDPAVAGEMLPDAAVSAVAVRVPDGHTSRVSDILRLLDGRPTLENASPYEVMADVERERRQLHHALSMLKVARQRLHEQYLENQREQERNLDALRERWDSRRRALEVQIAKASLQKARDELAEDRAQLEADFERRELEWQQQCSATDREWQKKTTLQQADLESLRRQFDESHRRQRDDLQRRELQLHDQHNQASIAVAGDDRNREELQRQLAETRRKSVRSELAVVEERAERTAERRQWNDERLNAESIIRDLLAELDSKPQPLAKAA